MPAYPHAPREFLPRVALLTVALLSSAGCSASGCADSPTSDSPGTDVTQADAEPDTGGLTPTQGLDTSLFDADALASPITQVACTLSNGATTTCYRVVIKGAPTDHEVGPFCPRHIDDGAEAAGIWIDDGSVYDVDGSFITGLAEFYSDENWQLYDEETGEVRVTTTQAACEAAARPDVAPEYNNYCVECELDYVDGGIEIEVLIPVTPVPRAATAELGRINTIGVSLNGAHYAPPAPVDAILAAYTIAAFDDCGGHVNTAVGYHYHSATGCPKEVTQPDGHAPLIGYVIDGYPLHALLDEDGEEPVDLDVCRGHTDATRGYHYHYHAASPGENMFVGCFHGETVGADEAGPGGPGGAQVAACGDVTADAPCCGDGVCDGPETAENCTEDCS